MAEEGLQQGIRCAMATVVAVTGSSYRRPGARLLTREDGAVVGCISGGCLERDVIQKSRLAIVEGHSRLCGTIPPRTQRADLDWVAAGKL
jgi:xanthine/CO dehydrogenase XdhC/CoxF family maturation factor